MDHVKITSKDKSKRLSWTFVNLNVPRPPQATKSLDLGTYSFAETFNSKKLDKIRGDAGRLPGGMRLGNFGEVVKQAEKTAKLFDAYQNDKKVRKGGLLSKKVDVTATEMKQQLQDVIAEAQEWLDAFDAQGNREKTGVISDTAVKADKHRSAKIQACKDMIAGANISLAQFRLDELERGVDPNVKAFAETVGTLERMRWEIGSLVVDTDRVDDFRRLDASVLQQVCGTKDAGGGTSEVTLIKAPDGGVAYAFKSIVGESDQTGMPKGAGAVREVLVSKLCDRVRDKAGLDFGWPAATLTEVDKKPGVIIAGLNGAKIHDKDSLGKVPEKDFAAEKKRSAELARALPAQEVHKMVLCNLALGQFDIKWDNAIIEDTPSGPQARPYDGGAALPPEDQFMDFAFVVAGQAGGAVMQDADGKRLDHIADAPIGQELIDAFSKIDEDDLLALAQSEMDKLSRVARNLGTELDAETLGVVNGCEVMARSIRGIKQLLQEHPDMTFEKFLEAVQQQVHAPIAASKKDAWMKKVKAQYMKLDQTYPGILPAIDKFTDEMNIWTGFVKPDQCARLPDLLLMEKVYGGRGSLKTKFDAVFPPPPFGSIKGAFNKVTNHRDFNAQERSKFPTITFPEKAKL